MNFYYVNSKILCGSSNTNMLLSSIHSVLSFSKIFERVAIFQSVVDTNLMGMKTDTYVFVRNRAPYVTLFSVKRLLKIFLLILVRR